MDPAPRSAGAGSAVPARRPLVEHGTVLGGQAAGGLTAEDRAVLDEWAPGWDG